MVRNKHYFYALKLPLHIKLKLQELCTELKGDLSFKSWVHHEDYHVTLAFLGNAPEVSLQTSIHLLRETVSGLATFPLTITNLGVFGKGDSPRIFWAGLERENQLFELRKQVYKACETAGFLLETRPFHPHITLARKWTGDVPFTTESLRQTDPHQFDATEVVLYETNIEKVPKYEVKQTFFLS